MIQGPVGNVGSPLRGMVNTGRTLSYYMRLQEVTANNLANSSTEAFKADRMTAHLPAAGGSPVPVEQTDLSQGTFRETKRELDLALEGPGFFVVNTAQGERLVRGGSFKLDGAGRLADAHGNPILGEGGPIVVTGADVEVGADGTVRSGGASVGRLRIETVEHPESLRKEAAGRFVPSQGTKPVAGDATQVRQGVLEEANLNSISSMVDLVAIQRAYAANIDAIKTLDGVLASITSEVGKT